MIADRGRVAEQITALKQQLDQLSEWTENPTGPFPADETELGKLLGEVAVMLLAGGRAPGDHGSVRA